MRVLPIIALAAGCYDPKFGPGGRCSTACPGDLVCVDGTCLEAEPEPSLVAHWRFDDPPEDGALDSSGRGHHGACRLCPVLVPGKIGGAYEFNAEEVFVVPDHPDFRGAYTIAAWVQTDLVHDQIAALSKPFGDTSSNSWQLEVLDDDRVSLSSGSPHSLRSPSSIAEEVWVHIAGTWDGTRKRLFIGGTQVAEVDASVEYDDHSVYLGGDQNSGNEVLHWEGLLDDLRVYDRALSDAELSALAR